MNKKAYQKPTSTVVHVKVSQILCQSSYTESLGGPTQNGGSFRARQYNGWDWDDDEDDDNY